MIELDANDLKFEYEQTEYTDVYTITNTAMDWLNKTFGDTRWWNW